MAIVYHRLYPIGLGATQTGAATPNRITLAATAPGVFASVDSHEELRQGSFSPMDTNGVYSDVLMINAVLTTALATFRLIASDGTVWGYAKMPSNNSATWPWFSGPVVIPAAQANSNIRLQLQYTCVRAVSFLAAYWMRYRTA